MIPNLTLVVGGAASGKSLWAENQLVRTGRKLVYVATAEARDAEMRRKIAAHVRRRGAKWRTVEAPTDIARAVAACGEHEAALIDCATMWLSNCMGSGAEIEKLNSRFLDGVSLAACPVVVVSNEIGSGIVPANELSRNFRTVHGELNQAIAEKAELVVNIVCGLPLVLKGALPQ
ncbi:MAG: bifunctional adenosylcobinamide kinase/adenosylcobinamide-phosphate guanylyltransferase [Albidovulum sp.]|nr:bifunctional adenosylcobinamide kinase/adenosylcobinamide-phosphate guanylyltransferase [Albidovulum sp.]